MHPMVIAEPSTFACTRDPERWTTGDDGAKALCRECPRRWRCAHEACRTPGAEGVWAGILIPEAVRGSSSFANSPRPTDIPFRASGRTRGLIFAR